MEKKGWVKKKLGEVCEVSDYVANGSFATLKANVEYKQTKDFAILVRLADYTNKFNEDKFVYIDEHAYNFLAKSKLFGGEIIISNVGSVGKLFICPDLKSPMSLAPNTIVVKTSYNKFFYHYFKSSSFQGKLKGITSQTALPKFNKTEFKKLSINMPPLTEQQQIVSELDCLQGIIDKKKEQLQELDKLAQSIFYTMFGECNSYLALSNYINSLNGGKSLASEEDNNNKVLKTSSVSSGFFKENEFKNLPTDYIPRKEHKVNVGDLLISRMNTPELVGTCAYVWHVNPNVFLPDRLWKATLFLDKVNPIFLWFALRQYSIREQIKKNSSGTSGSMKNISKSSLLKIKIHDVPLVIQQEFADKITAIEQQKTRIQQSLQDTETLFNSRMDYYFG